MLRNEIVNRQINLKMRCAVRILNMIIIFHMTMSDVKQRKVPLFEIRLMFRTLTRNEMIGSETGIFFKKA